MIDSLDHLIIAVKDLDEATKNYEILLGNEPVWQGEHKAYGTANTLFNFENTYLELLAAKGEGFGADLINYMLNEDGEGLAGLVLSTKDANKTSKSLASLGYDVADPAEGEGIN
jgi:catechol 2,3-dioxygenase-like lactoylglutathione lyase family enzyme